MVSLSRGVCIWITWDSRPEARLTHLPDDLTVDYLHIDVLPELSRLANRTTLQDT